MFSVYAAFAERAYPRRWRLAGVVAAGIVALVPLSALSGALWKPLFVYVAVSTPK
jgi:cytochrome c-type biogenesis protein CcmH/NrfG